MRENRLVRWWRGPKMVRVVNLQMAVDPETQQGVQFTTQVPLDATAAEVAAELATLREAGWAEVSAANARKLEHRRLLKAERTSRLVAARASKVKLDEDRIAEENAAIDTSIMELEADQAATAQLTERPKLTLVLGGKTGS